MAEIAIGANCSACGTLVACAGARSDARLVGVCPVCKVAVDTANREYVAPAAVEEPQVAAQPSPVVEPEPQPEEPVDNPVLPEAEDAPSQD